jgi:hypothetical protein
VTELHDEDGSIDIQIVGFDSPALTPLTEGGEYELEGLRYYDPDGERAYYELRPTTGIERLDDPEADTSSDNDGGGEDEQAETTQHPQTAHSVDDASPSSDTENTETAADGGEVTTESTESPPLEADSITQEDENTPDTPDTQDERLRQFKDTLDESTKKTEWLTADDLEDKLGWDRSIIDGILEKLQREGTVQGNDDIGWKYYG